MPPPEEKKVTPAPISRPNIGGAKKDAPVRFDYLNYGANSGSEKSEVYSEIEEQEKKDHPSVVSAANTFGGKGDQL